MVEAGGAALAVAALTGAALAAALGTSLRLAWTHVLRLGHRPSPPLASSLPPAQLAGAFATGNDQGAFGEALTVMALSAQGWRTLNGKPGPGPQGIDGVFLRDGPKGWEALLIETKTGASPLRPGQMADSKLLTDLDRLYLTEGDPARRAAYQAIHAGLSAGSTSVRKQLWRHALATGRTTISPLDAAGGIAGPGRMQDVSVLAEGLLAAAREIDRQGVYVRRG